MTPTLARLIQAGHPIISIESSDEDRAERIISEATREAGRKLRTWSVTEGLVEAGRYEVSGDRIARLSRAESNKPQTALQTINDENEEAVYLFRDLAANCRGSAGPVIVRMLRDFVRSANQRAGLATQTIILLEAGPLPPEIARLAARHEIGWPDEDELLAVVKDTYKRIKRQCGRDIKAHLRPDELEAVVRTLRGLSAPAAGRLIADVILTDDTLCADDLPQLVEGKRLLLGQTGALETIAADVTPHQIGGLENLKAWLEQRKRAFTSEAIDFGIDPPRGLLLLGVPGCGKSLCAKVVAQSTHMPLLRLDPGTLYTKFIGESENQLRRALRQAEAMAPCVLWIDEIEKAFASASAGSADGGLSQRMFGTLLSWMQDHRHPIFLVATANDISALPPELMRKGRFDEVFFVDLPKRGEREQILAIHLKRRDRDPGAFDLPKLAAAAEGFSGSELEQAIASALFAAFDAGEALADSHVLAAIESTRPLSQLSAESIASLRRWASERCVPA